MTSNIAGDMGSLQEVTIHLIQRYGDANSAGRSALPGIMPSDHERFLEAFQACNPFSAAALAGSGCSLQQMLHDSPEQLVTRCELWDVRRAFLFCCEAGSGSSIKELLGKYNGPVLQDRPALIGVSPLWQRPTYLHFLGNLQVTSANGSFENGSS